MYHAQLSTDFFLNADDRRLSARDRAASARDWAEVDAINAERRLARLAGEDQRRQWRIEHGYQF